MRNKLVFLGVLAAAMAPQWMIAQIFPALGGQRAGISALTFLKMDVSPRAAALGGASLCLTGDAYSTYTNPAALAEVENATVALSNTQWAGGINYGYLTASKPTSAGAFGGSVAFLSSGAIPVRTEFQPNGTGEYYYANAFKVGATYAKKLTDMFSYGVTASYVQEQLAQMTARTATVDLGFAYQTDFKDLRFGVMLQNFGLNSALNGSLRNDSAFAARARNIDNYPAPTVFKLGMSFVPWKTERQRLTALLQLDHPNDNAENIRIGIEYAYQSLLFARVGYKINVTDQDFPTAGAGIRTRIGRHPLILDYSFDRLQYMGNVNRIGLQLQLAKASGNTP